MTAGAEPPGARVALLAHRAGDPEPSGIGRYYVELVTSLALRHAHRYALCTTREPRPTPWLPAGVARHEQPGPRKLVALAWGTIGRPRADRAFDHPDLLHALHPWTATPSRAPLVSSVHDLMPLQHPRWYPRAEGWLYGRGIAHVRHHARLVIAHSAHGAAELEAEAGIESARVRVVHLAVGDEFRRTPPRDEVGSTCARYGVEPGRFLIAVGQVNSRKNLTVVLQAMSRLDLGHLGRPALLVAGSAGPAARSTLDAIDELGLHDRVRVAGYVPDGDLPVLVGAARALVHPSTAEGFGFTPLEAMAAGVPTISSTAGALPEMVASAGLLVDPDDTDGWADAIARVTTDAALHADLVARGAAHQDRFRWERVAVDTEQVYAEVLGHP